MAKYRNERRDEFANYVADPTETRARLNAIRKNAKAFGVYDPFTQPFKEEYLGEYQGNIDPESNWDPYLQLKNVYTDEQITDMLNKVSKSNTSKPQTMGKYGGLINKYNVGGIIQDDNGYWNPDNRGKAVEIQGNKMATHGYGNIPLYVVPDKGNPRLVKANTGIQTFPGATKFTEYPVTNNWLDRYK